MKTKFIVTCFMLTASVFFANAQGVSFTLDKTTGCVPLTVNFTNTSTVGVTYRWYGTSGADTARNTSYTYTTPGNFSITLYAYDAGGKLIGDSSAIIDVYGSYGNFFVSDNRACPNQDISFSSWDRADSYRWYFGDGDSALSSYTHHAYSLPGTYDVKRIISSACGIDTLTEQVVIDSTLLPTPYIFHILPSIAYYTQDKVCPDEMIQFYATTPYYVYSSDLVFHWDFGDNTTLTGSYKFPWHSYSVLGSYVVTLSVSNSCHTITSFSDTVFVVDTVSVPAPGFSITPVSGCSTKQLTFRQWRNYISHSWDFGDGTTDTSYSPTHTFPGTGDYIVKLTETNTCGNTGSFSDTVSVKDTIAWLPIPDFEVLNDTLCTGDQLMTFNWYSDYSKIGTVMWDFGDGTQDTGNDAVHNYTATGIYAVTKTLTSFCGASSSFKDTIVVSNSAVPLTPFFDSENACPGDTIRFETYIPIPYTYGSTLPYNAYKLIWDYGDGATDTTFNTYSKHAYTATGNYSVKVTAVNRCGNSSSHMEIVSIENGVIPNVAVSWQSNNGSGANLPCKDIVFNAQYSWQHNTVLLSYKWNFGDGDSLLTNASSVIHAYRDSGVYTIILTGINGCSNEYKYSQVITIAGVCTGITSYHSENNNVNVFPNPFSSSVTIQIRNDRQNGNYDLSVYDLTGRKVHQQHLKSETETLTLNLSAGIYFYKVSSDKQVVGGGKMVKW